MDSRRAVDFGHNALQSGTRPGPSALGLLAPASRPFVCSTDSVCGRLGPANLPDPQREIVSTLAKVLSPILRDEALAVSGDLLARFGTISRLLDAAPEAVRSALPGRLDAADKVLAARELCRVGWREVLVGQIVNVESRDLITFLTSRLQSDREERVHAIFLSVHGVYIQDEIITRGGVRQAPLETRHLVHRAFDLQAHKVILSHNHPSGSCLPSDQDELTTAKLRDILAALSIELLDHLIVGGNRVYSMRKGEVL